MQINRSTIVEDRIFNEINRKYVLQFTSWYIKVIGNPYALFC